MMTSLVSRTIDVDLSLLDVDSSQNPRQTLGLAEDSIETFAVRLGSEGQLTPITVRPTSGGRFALVAGYRRVKAAHVIGWTSLRAEVLDARVSDEQCAILARVENLDRVGLSDYDIAYSTLQLQVHKIPLQAVADRTGYSFAKLNKMVGWLRNLPPEVIDGWKNGDPRVNDTLLSRLSIMDQEKALGLWVDLHASPAQLLIPRDKLQPKPRALRRPSITKVSVLMERVRDVHLIGLTHQQFKAMLIQTVEYCLGVRKKVPDFRVKTKGKQ